MAADIAINFVNGGVYDVLGQDGCVEDLLNQRHCREVSRGGRPVAQHESISRFDSIVNFADEDLLMSGWAKGTEHIAKKTAMARVPHGKGNVVVFGFRPQFRGQPRGTYKLVFNALYDAAVD